MIYRRIDLPALSGGSVPMDMYLPAVSGEIDPSPCRRSIVICPGGGYEYLSEREAEPIALRFAGMGFNCFVVWYRVAPHRYPLPQQDVACAVAYVRRHAAELHSHPDRIAVMGFSAGGHVAGSLGVWWPKAELWQPLSPEDVRPNAMVLCYPVISGGPRAHRGSFVNLSGTEDVSAHTAFSLDEHVTAQTPPAFLWHTWDDTCVPVDNTLLMASALRRCNVAAEVHIFPHGSHGLALADETTTLPDRPDMLLPDCAKWPVLAARFLKGVLA